MQELKGTENELRQLLTASNARNEEMELQVFEQEEQLEKLKTELDNVTKGKRRFFLKNLHLLNEVFLLYFLVPLQCSALYTLFAPKSHSEGKIIF